MSEDVEGILILDKPLGMTSAAAVARLKGLFGARKTGHTGSLDPLATGALILCFGEATKFGSHLLDADKTYEVGIRLGERTASGDRETPVIERREPPALSDVQLRAALERFPRQYDQIPPMHSALKQEGRALYLYARAGVTRARAARRVQLHRLRLLEWRAPELNIEVACSKGTYIRVLAEEIAAALGTIAHLSQLRRLSVAPFEEARPHSLEMLERLDPDERRNCLMPIDAALQHYPRIDLNAADAAQFRRGQSVGASGPGSGMRRIYAADGRFLGLGELKAGGRLQPRRLVAFAAA